MLRSGHIIVLLACCQRVSYEQNLHFLLSSCCSKDRPMPALHERFPAATALWVLSCSSASCAIASLLAFVNWYHLGSCSSSFAS